MTTGSFERLVEAAREVGELPEESSNDPLGFRSVKNDALTEPDEYVFQWNVSLPTVYEDADDGRFFKTGLSVALVHRASRTWSCTQINLNVSWVTFGEGVAVFTQKSIVWRVLRRQEFGV